MGLLELIRKYSLFWAIILQSKLTREVNDPQICRQARAKKLIDFKTQNSTGGSYSGNLKVSLLLNIYRFCTRYIVCRSTDNYCTVFY